MKAKVQWCGEKTFLGTSQSGHHVTMDGQLGQNSPSPMEMVLMGAGGCSSIDVIEALVGQEQQVDDCEVILTAKRRDEAPRIFTAIHFHFVVQGRQVDENLVDKAVVESLDKYCSVCLMLGKGVEMSHSYEIINRE